MVIRCRSAFIAPVVLSAGLFSCGGSSSETPFPLPPHALHEPYRARPSIASAGSTVAEPRQTERTRPVKAAPARDPDAADADAGPPAPATWGQGREP